MTRYTTTWRNKFLPEAKNIDELIDVLSEAQHRLMEMQEAGVRMEPMGDDYYLLHTNNPVVADRFGMHNEEETYEYGGEG